MPRRLKNIRRWKNGYQAYTEIHGKTYSKSYPLSATVDEMRTWIKSQRETHKLVKDERGSFAADVAAYLPRVMALATYSSRAKHLELWMDALGRDRPRRTITAAEIDRVLQTWLLDGLSPSTVKKRRMVLLSMWNMLDGKEAPNPVRASASPRDPKPEARGLPYDVIQRLIDVMPPSASKLRITVLAWTGLPPGMLGKVQRDDLNLPAKQLRVRPRRKGAGVEARTLPLLPQAVTAFKAFDKANIYGPFNVPSLNALLQRACQRTTPPVTGISLYDLRHSFGTMLYRVTKDLATVARFLLHSNVAMSARYAAGAMQDVDRAAANTLGKHLSRKPVRRNKSKRPNDLHV